MEGLRRKKVLTEKKHDHRSDVRRLRHADIISAKLLQRGKSAELHVFIRLLLHDSSIFCGF